MQYEDVLCHIGSFGKYQKLLIASLALFVVPGAFHVFGQVFLAAKTDHWCAVLEDSQTGNCTHHAEVSSVAGRRDLERIGIPYELDPDGRRVYSSCERYAACDEDGGAGLNSTDIVPCDAGWVFDQSRYKTTIIEDFRLVCDREGLAGVSQSVFFAGILTGSLVWGTAADWIGRRRSFILTLSLACISSTVTTIVPNFVAYAAMQFITAACTYGTFFITFVLASEMVGPTKRVLVGMVTFLFSSVGYMLLTGLAFLIREWRYLQLAMSLSLAVAFLLVAVLPESPRWLMSKGRFPEAIKIIERVARVNGTRAPENLLNRLSEGQQDDGHSSRMPVTHLDLVRTPNLRRKTLILCLDWFVVNMGYYGITLSTSALGIDDYVAALVSGAVEIPSVLFCWYVMERFGRRSTLSAFYVAGGLLCLITTLTPKGGARAAVAMMGKFSINAAFANIYVYSCELYPTVVRSMGMGASSISARVSGILCPIILILGKYWEPLPLCIFGGSSILAGVVSLLLPETLGFDMPDTIQDGEQFGKNQRSLLCCWGDPVDRETTEGRNGNDIPPDPPVDYVALPSLDKPQKPVTA